MIFHHAAFRICLLSVDDQQLYPMMTGPSGISGKGVGEFLYVEGDDPAYKSRADAEHEFGCFCC